VINININITQAHKHGTGG